MWSPTHVQVLVKRAKGLNTKGKNGTNDALVTISLEKEKYQTSVKERAKDPVEWSEQCELPIPTQGNQGSVVFNVLHRNYLGVDEFLGQASIPLKDQDVYASPRTQWLPLMCKPGQQKNGYRGELEVKLGFTVRAQPRDQEGSLTSLSRTKMRGSFTSLSKAGSLLSIGGRERRKGSKVSEMARRVSSRVGGRKEGRMDRLEENFDRFAINNKNRDPGVNTDEEDEDMMMIGGRDDMFQFDRLSHCSSSLRSELSLSRLGTVSPAASTPDIEAMRQPSKNQFGARETEVNEVPKRPSNLVDFEATRKPSNSDIESVRRPSSNASELFETNINNGWKRSENGRRIKKEEERRNTTEGKEEIAAEERRTDSGERPPSAETVAGDYSLPSYHQAMSSSMRKIIPVVQSDDSSSPQSSPNSPPSSASSTSSPPSPPPSSTFSSRFRHQQGQELGSKLQKSFRGKEREQERTLRKLSLDSTASSSSSSSSSCGPPNGNRVVVGREKSPDLETDSDSNMPAETMVKFKGMSREDMIEVVIRMEAVMEEKGKRIADMEDYLDSLLLRVMETAPAILAKDAPGCKNE